jgi:hypothetical protein
MVTNPDGSYCEKPCLFGIYPGVIQQSEDEKRLSQFPWMKDVTLSKGDLSGWFDIAGQNATFFATSNSSVAFYLEIWDGFVPQQVSFPQPSLGDVLGTFGVPSFVNWKDNSLMLWYKKENLFVWCEPIYSAPAMPINLNMRVEGVEFYASEDIVMKNFHKIEWRGFVSIARYIVSP